MMHGKPRTPGTILLDVDGTLVDTNYHHAVAWYRGFRQHGLTLPVWRLHRHIGMGGDHLVKAVAGERVERELGDAIRESASQRYAEVMEEAAPFAGAADMLGALRDEGWTAVLASSARQSELDHYIEILHARGRVAAWTGADDVAATKPEPDLIQAALGKVGATSGLMVGDSVFDCAAAARAGIDSVALLTGGFSREELTEAGALEVFESLGEFQEWLGLRAAAN
ncbi:MAG TPA: HAD family hydrolase [Actinomycetota bacterium]|nr:HAD family hydrolase [Actinomycetota bacterium]